MSDSFNLWCFNGCLLQREIWNKWFTLGDLEKSCTGSKRRDQNQNDGNISSILWQRSQNPVKPHSISPSLSRIHALKSIFCCFSFSHLDWITELSATGDEEHFYRLTNPLEPMVLISPWLQNQSQVLCRCKWDLLHCLRWSFTHLHH